MSSAAIRSDVEPSKADGELVITRIFDAPRELVFRAWTEPDRAVRWWGPQGFIVAHSEIDLQPGGAYRVCMRSPEGIEHWQRGVCREFVEPERLVFTFAWEDAEGKVWLSYNDAAWLAQRHSLGAQSAQAMAALAAGMGALTKSAASP